MLDGFIAGAAAMAAVRIKPDVRHYLIASHRSTEPGAGPCLNALGLEPYLDLDMRLGEGTGAALCIGLAKAAIEDPGRDGDLQIRRRDRSLAVTALCRALVLLLLLLPGIACALTLVDQTGRTLTLPAPPRRIVSLVPSVTEILFAIGAQDALVGVTDFCDYPPEARRKPRVGDMLSPNLETLVSLKPDLVVATRSGNRRRHSTS